MAAIAHPGNTAAQSREMVERIRMVGLDKILYGSDAAAPGQMKPRDAWAAFRALPLSDAELKRIAGNVAPYLR